MTMCGAVRIGSFTALTLDRRKQQKQEEKKKEKISRENLFCNPTLITTSAAMATTSSVFLFFFIFFFYKYTTTAITTTIIIDSNSNFTQGNNVFGQQLPPPNVGWLVSWLGILKGFQNSSHCVLSHSIHHIEVDEVPQKPRFFAH